MATPSSSITIDLLRVSADSDWLEFIVECPINYVFNTLEIQVYNISTKGFDSIVDCSLLLQGTTTREAMRIATSALGINTTMYKVTFGVTGGGSIPNSTGVCSNVNFVYANLLDLILKYTNCCISNTDYDNLDRNYMILYAHQEAMRLGRYEDAIYFYNILWNLFVSCGPTTRQTNLINKPCNC